MCFLNWNIQFELYELYTLNLSHIFLNYQLPANSVFIRGILHSYHVNGVTRIIKVDSRFPPEPTRRLHGVYTDHPGWSHLSGPPRTTTDVWNFPKRPCWHQGTPRISPDVPGQARTTTDLHGSYTAHTPDQPGCDPCWSGTIMDLGLATVPYEHGRVRRSRRAPDRAGPWSGMIRAQFGAFQHRQSASDRHAGANTVCSRTNTVASRMNTAVLRNQHGTHTDSQGLPRTYTEEPRINTNQHGSYTDQHDRYTDQRDCYTDQHDHNTDQHGN